MEHRDIFKKACLIQLSTSVWQCSRVIDQSIMDKLASGNEWVKGRKFLINPELLGPIKTTVHQARNHIQRFSLPFPITSVYLVPKETLTVIDDRMEYFKTRFWDKVGEFEAVYDAALEEARDILGDLYNDSDYPLQIKKKFRFEWRYFVLEVPGKASVLTPEIYEREKQKFENLMEETRELAMAALREEFGHIVHHLVNRLNDSDGKPKVIQNSMFNKMREFLDDFNTRNLFKDEKLRELTRQAQEIIGGVSPFGMRYNDVLRKKIHNDMNRLKNDIDEAIEEIPRRKIRLAV